MTETVTETDLIGLLERAPSASVVVLIIWAELRALPPIRRSLALLQRVAKALGVEERAEPEGEPAANVVDLAAVRARINGAK